MAAKKASGKSRSAGRSEKAKTAGVISLGCSKNLVDTEFLMGGMAGCGWSFTPVREDAELLLVNTCAFLDSSVEESEEAIEEALEWKRRRGEGTVVVAGCLVSRFGRALKARFPEVDLFLTPGQIPRVPRWVTPAGHTAAGIPGGGKSYLPPPGADRLVTTGPWAYLKISDGCDNRCSYCLIPSIRGAHRSRSLRALREETEALVAAGVREINLVGQDITRWGQSRRSGGLRRLVLDLARLPGDFRLRLLYLHPSRVDRELVRIVAGERKVFPYLDMPIQHASDRVLRGMGRSYGRRRLERTLEMLRRSVPDIALRTTVMVGFPGEGRREFGELLSFLREHPFDNLGAFVFSPQEGTAAAARRGKVPAGEAEERYHRVMELQREVAAGLWKGRRGKTTEAILLAPLPGKKSGWLGRTAWQAPEVDGQIRVQGPGATGALVPVRITGSSDYDLMGVITGEAPS